MKKSGRSLLLDLIRIVSISLVIGDHILQHLTNPTARLLIQSFGIKGFYWTNMGSVGVTLFLILSGMALEYNHGKEKIKYFSFIAKRFTRIYSTYWLCILFSIPLVGIEIFPHNFKDIFLNLSGLFIYTGRPWTDYFIPTAFFLGIILYLYFLFPLISKAMKQRPTLTILSLLIISVAARLYMGHQTIMFRPTDSYPLARVFEFGFGIWIVNQKKAFSIIAVWGQNIKTNFFQILSELSFPAFLMHSALLRLNLINPSEPKITITKFLELTLVLSFAIYALDKLVQKKIFRKN